MPISYNQRVAIIAGLLLTFFLLTFGGVTYYKMKPFVEEEIIAKQINKMRLFQQNINGLLEPSIRLVGELKKELDSYTVYNKEEIVPLLARSKNTIDSVQVYFGLEDGRMMYNTGKELRMDWYDPRTRPWYIKGLEADSIVVSDPFVGFASNQLTFTIMTPIIQEGRKQGVVAASFYLNKLYQKIKGLTLEGEYTFIVNAEGKIILHPDKSMINKKLSEQNLAFKKMYETMRLQKEGFFEYAVDGTKELLTFGELCNGWFCIVSIEDAKAYAFMHTMLKLFWIMGILMVILTVMVLVRVSRKSGE